MEHQKAAAMLEAVRQGSFSKAAEQLGYTQSGLTRMINTLETEIGYSFLEKNFRGVRLSREGEMLLPYFRNFVETGNLLDSKISEIANHGNISFTFASLPSLCEYLLPTAIHDFSETHPNVVVNLRIMDVNLANQVASGDIQFGIIDSDYIGQNEWIPFMKDPMYAVVPSDFPFPAKEPIPLTWLSQHRIIVSENHPATDALIEMTSSQPLTISSNNASILLGMVQEGLGVTLLSSLMQNPKTDITGVRFLRTEPAFYRTIGVITKSFQTLSPITKQFIRHIFDYVPEEHRIDTLSLFAKDSPERS